MFARNAWYMAGWSRELDRKPLTRRLLGGSVALFRNAEGVAHALDAVCPHRGSDLGRGRVVDSTLECPGHGWRFSTDGRCECIPSQPGDLAIPRGAHTRSYSVREQQGLLWIWLGEHEQSRPQPPWHSFWEPAPRQRRSFGKPELIDAPFLHVVENAIDNSHLSFVHRQTLPGYPKRIPRQRILIDEDARGFTGDDDPESPWTAERVETAGTNSWLGILMGWLSRPQSEYHYRFELPGLVFHHQAYDNGTWDVILVNITPANESQTWVFPELVRTRAPHLLGEILQRFVTRRLTREDHRALTTMLACDPGGLENSVNVAADDATLAFRTLYARLAGEEGRKVPWQELPDKDPELATIDGEGPPRA
ncbi:MAG: aromatic ring-hydroxylating dioxygenase subunit alpha [bacterium]|nr:aromatic ring-hydroxylating dioxygenase subunit alpha [bacterium]